MFIKKLTGNSGCDIQLCQNNKVIFVRKISGSKAYNVRLQNQVEKQINFSKIDNGIFTPEIYDAGINNDGLYYFDMEYIHGNIFSDYIRHNDINSIKPISEKILKFLNRETVEKFDATKKIAKKIDSLPDIDDNTRSLILNTDWRSTPKSFCHGDLTFENMIVSNGKLYLIDFLDSFIGTELIDISKLIFDIRYFWSHRNCHKKSQAIIRNIFFEKKLRNLPAYNEHENKINCLVIMSILRIIPYISDDNTSLKKYLNRCLKDATKDNK